MTPDRIKQCLELWVHVHMWAHTCVCVCMCVHVFVHECACACSYVCMLVCVHVCAWVCVGMCVFMHPCLSVHAYVGVNGSVPCLPSLPMQSHLHGSYLETSREGKRRLLFKKVNETHQLPPPGLWRSGLAWGSGSPVVWPSGLWPGLAS